MNNLNKHFKQPMSIETWKAAFYKAEAADTAIDEALEHSILKWEGLRKANLDEHELRVRGRIILVDKTSGYFTPAQPLFKIDETTCALCAHHILKKHTCLSCPLFKALNGNNCDAWPVNDSIQLADSNPYQAFTSCGDPEPMIRALKKARKFNKPEGNP